MTACTQCGQSSGSRLCRECRLDDEREFFEKRAEEMGAGTIRTGPDADDVTIVGGDQDDA